MTDFIIELSFVLAGIYSILTIKKSYRTWKQEYPGSRYNLQGIIFRLGMILLMFMVIIRWLF